MIFVVDPEQRPLAPCHPARARRLLTSGKAAVWRRYPFTIILQRSVPDAASDLLRLKIDPGSTVTGLVVISDPRGQVVWAAEPRHRGQQVRAALLARCTVRRSRRQRYTHYRPTRFANRRRQQGWLPPSLARQVANVTTWVARLQRLCPIGSLSMELVRFATQLLQHPEIAGVEYQQGELAGYEVREYLLEKWGRQCAYCKAMHIPLQIEHITTKSRSGSDHVGNLTLACKPCNQTKGDRTAIAFGYAEIAVQAQRPLRNVAAVNATRWLLYHQLVATELPVETDTGGRTKYKRTQCGLPKTYWLDAACVGASTPTSLQIAGVAPVLITATGRPSRHMCRLNAFRVPDKGPKATSVVGGMRRGDHAHGRYSVRGGTAALDQGGGVCRAARGARHRLVQRYDERRHGARHSHWILPATPSWGRLSLSERGGGASSPWLTPQGSPRCKLR